jgi:putative membrane protein
MLILHQVLPGEPPTPLPPQEITENVADTAGAGEAMDDAGESGRNAVTTAAHFGYGAAAGLGYIPFAGKSGMHPAAEGALYGLAVWGGSYLGVMPATGLYRSATDEPAARNVLMVTAHLVWGAALGMVYERLTRSES